MLRFIVAKTVWVSDRMPMHFSSSKLRPSLSLVLLVSFLMLLWLAGGASRADAPGQVLVRAGGVAILIVVCLAGNRPAMGDARTVWWLLIAALVLALLQLIPLPPAVWQSLPGHSQFGEALALGGQPLAWRPWSLSPAATINAAFSLIVPFTVLVLVGGLKDAERLLLPGILLGLMTAAMLVGLMQFSGAWFNNPLINDVAGQVAGTFANRNHFAVFMAIGCLVAPVWAFQDGRQPKWRGPVAMGLVILFMLVILASGSRAGILVGALSLVLALAMVWEALRRALIRYPRWVSLALPGGAIVLVLIFVAISVAAGRAVSVDRVFALDQGQDMRTRGLPTVLAMTREYFPFGSGLGGFDAVFRAHEPFELLKPTYFNRAHNDLLEVVLDAGVAGALLLLVALGWLARSGERAWRAGSSMRHALPKLGSAILLLLVLASAFDYPARTPMMMAMIVIAALWLKSRPSGPSGSALPQSAQHL